MEKTVNNASKNVVLIAPSWFIGKRLEYLPQNLGLGYIASYLEKFGHKVKIIDALAEGLKNINPTHWSAIRRIGLDTDRIIRNIPVDTDFIGIAVPYFNNLPIIKEMVKIIKSSFNIPIFLGGSTVSILKEALIDYGADFLSIGEGEKAVLNLVNGQNPEKIKGLIFKKDGKVINTGMPELIDNLNNIPNSARHLLPMNLYLSKSGRGREDLKAVSIITSRGCPYDCNFCSIHHIYTHKYRARSAENVLNEIIDLKQKYAIEHVEFEDDNFTLDYKRAEEIFDGLIRNNLNITWSLPNGVRIDTLDYNLIEKMKKSGCSALFLSIESGDPDILKLMNKKLDLEKVAQVVKMCGKLNINTSAVFIVGHPGETQESFKKTVEYIKNLKKLGLVGVGASIAKAYAGAKLRDYCAAKGYKLINDDYMNIPRVDEFVNIIGNELTEKESNRRLKFIKKNLNPLRYWTELFKVDGILKKIIKQKNIDLLKKKIYSIFR